MAQIKIIPFLASWFLFAFINSTFYFFVFKILNLAKQKKIDNKQSNMELSAEIKELDRVKKEKQQQ